MKKLMLALAALAGIATATLSAVEYSYSDVMKNVSTPLYNNRTVFDQNVVKGALDYLGTVEAKNDGQRLSIVRYKVMAYDQTTGADRTLEGLKKYADGLLAEVKFEKALTPSQYVSLFSLWWRSKETDFAEAVYNFMKATPGAEKFADMGIWAAATGHYEEAYQIYFNSKQPYAAVRAMNIATYKLGDAVKAFEAAKVILVSKANAQEVKQVVTYLSNNIVGRDEIKAEEVKAFLQNLNRKYTARLSEDSATWEPIISQIRTILEAY